MPAPKLPQNLRMPLMRTPAAQNPGPAAPRLESSTPGPGHTQVCTEKMSRVKDLYKVIRKHSGLIGGSGHAGPIFGEITMGSFQNIVNFLCEHLDFDSSSSFLDIGSGLGKPSLHVALNPGVRLSFGIEVEDLRWKLSMHNLRYALKEVGGFPSQTVHFVRDDVANVHHLTPFTHIYMFDLTFLPALMSKVGRAFNNSSTVRSLVSFQRPDRITFFFNVDLVGQIRTRMHCSSENHTAFIYRSKRATSLEVTTHYPEVSDGILQYALQLVRNPNDYSQWVVSSGILGPPGEERVKISACKPTAARASGA